MLYEEWKSRYKNLKNFNTVLQRCPRFWPLAPPRGMNPGVCSLGISEDPPRYLSSKFDASVRSDCWDISIWKTLTQCDGNGNANADDQGDYNSSPCTSYRRAKNCITVQSPLFFFLCTLLYFIYISGPMEKQLWRVWSVSSLFTAYIFQNCFLRKENIFAYLLPGTFIGWQLQNKLFNKPGLLTGSSGQIFQIKLNYCRSAFFHLSASWTLFWSWMPDKLCHEKIYVSYDVSPPPPPPLCKDLAWDLHIYQVWLEILSVLSGTSFDQVVRVYRLFRGSDSCTYSAYRFCTTMHMVLIIVHCSFFPFLLE